MVEFSIMDRMIENRGNIGPDLCDLFIDKLLNYHDIPYVIFSQ
jgi:hypothetical protein